MDATWRGYGRSLSGCGVVALPEQVRRSCTHRNKPCDDQPVTTSVACLRNRAVVSHTRRLRRPFDHCFISSLRRMVISSGALISRQALPLSMLCMRMVVPSFSCSASWSGLASGLLWKYENTATAGTASTDDGLANCGYIVASDLTFHPAARHCMSWNGGGFNDWYLGSVNELAFIRSRLWSDLPGVNANYGPAGAQRFGQSILQYWSSTTSAAISAVLYHFGVNANAPANKMNALCCRPIRRVLKV